MARRVICLADWDYRALPSVTIAYLAGWTGRVLEAAWRAAPAGIFQEIEDDGATREP